MVPPLGIEPSYRVLQTRAEMTTLAQAAFKNYLGKIV